MSVRFDGRTVVITGAGGGLGRDYAHAFAGRGANVVVNDLGGSVNGELASGAPAEEVAREIRAAGGRAVANFDDVGTPEGAGALCDLAVREFGSLDVLIANAGILRDKTLVKMPPEDFEAVVRVHLLGTALCARAALPRMRAGGAGRMVFTTSTAGLYGNFGQTNYAAAKLGIVGLMHALKLEAARGGVLVNTVAPLAVTRMGSGVFPPEVEGQLPPLRVTPLVLFLASTACATSGDVFVAGGGRFRRVRLMEGRGADFGAAEVTPELIAARFDEISSLDGARTFDDARQELADVLGALKTP